MTGILLLCILGAQIAVMHRLKSLVGEAPEPIAWTEAELMALAPPEPMWATVPTDSELRIARSADGDALYLQSSHRPREASDLIGFRRFPPTLD
jgi:hypothetical protein